MDIKRPCSALQFELYLTSFDVMKVLELIKNNGIDPTEVEFLTVNVLKY